APETSSTVHGVVKDRSGKAIVGAKVSLLWTRNYVSSKTTLASVGSLLESYTTDEMGQFTSFALWPGDQYKVVVDAQGYGKGESANVSPAVGKKHDFGTITLVGTNSTLAGKVIDTDGHAVAGVTVFNRGDSP